MNTSPRSRSAIVAIIAALSSCVTGSALAGEPVNYRGYQWTAEAPRDEIRPKASFVPGGVDGQGSLVLDAAGLEGAHGWWQATVPVTGGKSYRFSVLRKTTGVEVPRRSAYVRIEWRDEKGRAVNHDEPGPTVHYNASPKPRAEPEYPTDKTADSRGWTELSDTYHVPTKAARAIIELYLIWTPGRVEYSGLSLQETSAPAGRHVRLATVHLRPKSADKTPEGNCRLFEPFIQEAAKQKVDLIVLPESLTWYGTGKELVDVAEPIPGPSTRYFGGLAKKYDMYIVAGLTERDGHLIYNTAALIGPDGALVGKYRKVTLPRGEVESGLQPGHEYPVFEARFGKVGMMICYDGFYPEVARQLTFHGAEVIAWPVAGCNPLLGARGLVRTTCT